MLDLIIKNGQCYIDGGLKNVDVAIKDGKIQQIGQILEEAKDTINVEGYNENFKVTLYDNNTIKYLPFI